MAGGTLHTIMVPVRGDGKGDNVLAHAAALAHRFGARVRVVHCHPKPDDLMPYGVVIPQILRGQIEAAIQQNAEVTEGHLTDEFRTLAASMGLAEGDPVPGNATARFIEYHGKQTDAVQRLGRLADIICVPKPDAGSGLGKNTLKAALFSSGRPVMMCPHQDPVAPDFSARVAIGWNGSLEATRAVAMAMPLIAAADAVTILSSGDSEHAAGADELARYLELKSVTSEIRRFAPKGTLVGAQLVEECAAAGAGTLIMGAYHDSYERESLFGGNSQLVVDKASFPVVFVH